MRYFLLQKRQKLQFEMVINVCPDSQNAKQFPLRYSAFRASWNLKSFIDPAKLV